MDVLNAFTTLVVTLLILLFQWMMKKYNHWDKLGIQTPPNSFIFGSVKDLILQRKTFADTYNDMYKTLKAQGLRYGGFYFLLRPYFIPIDLKIVRNILHNEDKCFLSRGIYVNEKPDPLSANLFLIEGEKWKHLRNKLSPTFSGGKMKMMFESFRNCADELIKVLEKNMGTAVDIRDVSGRYTIDIIGRCAFGLECNSLADPNSQFRTNGRKIFERNLLEKLKFLAVYVCPKVVKFFGLTLFPKSVNSFIMNVVKETVSYREKHNIIRNDFMHLLIQLKNRGKLVDDGKLTDNDITSEKNKITINEVAAQAFVFFAAGFETASITMTFCLFELAQNEEIQNRARKEVVDVMAKHDNLLTYEAVMEMTYLESVIKETLRKYPPLPYLDRICVNDYTIPDTDIVLEKGTKILVSLYGIQHDPEYFPEPEKFDPERFIDEEQKASANNTFLAFGDGPRICIGRRFGMLETKVAIATLLKSFEFSVNQRTKTPIEFDTSHVMIVAKGDIWLDCQKIP